MAKQLNTKVTHCPECGILKSKTKPCKHCGYDESKETVHSIKLSLSNTDMSKYDSVIINGVEFYK